MPHPLSKEQQKLVEQLAARVKQVREGKGKTLQEVAHAIGKDHQSLFRLEAAKVSPSFVYLVELCKGLDISISELLEEF